MFIALTNNNNHYWSVAFVSVARYFISPQHWVPLTTFPTWGNVGSLLPSLHVTPAALNILLRHPWMAMLKQYSMGKSKFTVVSM